MIAPAAPPTTAPMIAPRVVDLDTAGAVSLGRTVVIPVRIPAEDARVDFAVLGR